RFVRRSKTVRSRAGTRRSPSTRNLTVRIDPRMSARQRSRAMQQQIDTQLAAAREQSPGNKKRMPKRGGRHIATYVEWLVQPGLHGVRMPALARTLLRSERDVPRSSKYDARQRIQYGLGQARTLLALVARLPSSRPAQPKRRTTRKSSTP